MKSQTDRDMLYALGWIQTTLRGRQDDQFKPTLGFLNEAESRLRKIVEAPRTACEETFDKEPAVVARIRKAG